MMGSISLLIFLCGNSVVCDELLLVDQSELHHRLPDNPWDLVLQNPFRGVVEIMESPVDKFQILINVSAGAHWSGRVNYNLRQTDDSLYVELLSQVTQSSKSMHTTSSNLDEEKIYLQLLFITVDALILVVFVVSLIFSCWWLKSQKISIQEDENVNAVYYVTVPPEITKMSEPKRTPNKPTKPSAKSADDQTELIELLPSSTTQNYQNFDAALSQINAIPNVTYATLPPVIGSTAPAGVGTPFLPTTYPVPRYVIAGGVHSPAGILDINRTFDGTQILGGAPIILSAPTDTTPGLLDTSMVPGNLTGTYLELAQIASPIPGGGSVTVDRSNKFPVAQEKGRTTVHSSLRLRTQPNKRHVAKEFLDESVVATMTKSRAKKRQPLLIPVQSNNLTTDTSLIDGVHPSVSASVLVLQNSKIVSSQPSINLEAMKKISLTAPSVAPVLTNAIFTDHMDPLTNHAHENANIQISSDLPDVKLAQSIFVSSLHPHSPNETTKPIGLTTVASSMAVRNDLVINPSSTILPLSLLTSGTGNATSKPYVSSSLLFAEVASCPQHSYLFRQTAASDTFTSPKLQSATIATSISQSFTPDSHEGTVKIQSIAQELVETKNATVAPNDTETITDCLDPPSSSMAQDDHKMCNSNSLGHIRPGPNPPKRSVSLNSKLPEVTAIENAQETKADSIEDIPEEGISDLTVVNRMEYKSSTLGRLPTNETSTEDESSEKWMSPGSSSTLPSNLRSVLKSGDKSRPKVSKHLRFTTLTTLAFFWLIIVVALCSPETLRATNQPVYWNIIKAPLSTFNNSGVPSKDDQLQTPQVRVTIWLPKSMIQSRGDFERPVPSASSNSPNLYAKRPPSSIQLWVNSSSATEVWLAPMVERSLIQIYDAVNAHRILGTRTCRQRYACDHSCDPGAGHDCFCQRGYRPAGPEDRDRLLASGNRLGNIDLSTSTGRICLDVDECASLDVRNQCKNQGGVCTNRPGDYACLCPSGKPCLDCSTICPSGYWLRGNCERNQPVECKVCSGSCPTGMYESRPCTTRADRDCRACRPLCISEEFEFAPCKTSGNRVCKRRSLIPELVVPYKKNIWSENRQLVRDTSIILTPDDLIRLPANKSIVLHRGSGYQVRIEFDSLNLQPVLGPVDHSTGNDNELFLAFAAALDRSLNVEPENFRWSSATGQYHSSHAYSMKANNTLSKLCPYPVPPVYVLGLRVHRNVTTATVPDSTLPGHRPVLSVCQTYRRHGYFPPVGRDYQSSAEAVSGTYNSENSWSTSNGVGEPKVTAPVVACLEPSRLPAIFGTQWNTELASHRAVYYEEKQLCGQLKSDCQHCLASCAEELKSNSLTCKPTANPADNGRSPRLELCFDCCARDNCTDVCDKYSAHRCHMRLCNHGLRLDFLLIPEWPRQGEFLCHVKPVTSRPIYRLHWSLLYRNQPLTPDRFPAALLLPDGKLSDLNDQTGSGKLPTSIDNESVQNWKSSTVDGQFRRLYRRLLNIQYVSGLDHLPDMIGGTDTMQSAYFWSKQTIPLTSGIATTTSFDPISTGSASTGSSFYPSTLHSSGLPSHDLTGIRVWPSEPLGVSTAAWARLSGAPCAAADPLLDNLNSYTSAVPPYIAMGEAKVEYLGSYMYTVSHTKIKPKIVISLSKASSLLGAVFSSASVERGQYLRASLSLVWLTPETNSEVHTLPGTGPHHTLPNQATPERYWVIDLTGKVDQFPGLFRLQLFPEGSTESNENEARIVDAHPDATIEVEEGDDYSNEESDEEPLIDYDIGVFEEQKFQLQIRIPGPSEEPNYDKSFRLVILDAHNRLDIRVKRAAQPPNQMALRQLFEVSSRDDMRPSINDLLPSMSLHSKSSIPHPQSNISMSVDGSFGPPPPVVYAVILTLCLLLFCLAVGLFTQPDPTMSWIKFPPSTGTSQSQKDGNQVILVPNPSYHQSLLSRWCRVILLVGYLCLKAAYSFGITLTALVIVIRYCTRDPAIRLAGLPEWRSGAQSSSEFIGTSLTKQKLMQDAMDVHLRTELVRQQTLVRSMRERCDRGVDKLFDQMEERLDSFSKLAASRRSRVLLSQAVAELGRVSAVSSALKLEEGLINFNQSASWSVHRLKSDLFETERALASSDWLTSARIIYAEVIRLRGLTPNPADPTRSFLQWAKLISPQGLSLESLAHIPRIQQPDLLSILKPEQFQLPTPPMMRNPLIHSVDEPEYGPPYIPFVPSQYEPESNEAYWSNNYEDGIPELPIPSHPFSFEDAYEVPTEPSSKPSDSNASGSSAFSGVQFFGSIQIGWVHILGATLLLDALWLIHRVLHTVDTAERILYGDTMFIDLTMEGLRNRLAPNARLRYGCKRLFEAVMQPGAVRKLVGSSLLLLAVTQFTAHTDRLLSQETLGYIGYYDNLILPVHLHARLVNVHITRSAQRLNQYEVAGLELDMSRRFQEAQLLLNEWTSWLDEVEQEQCRFLLTYKVAAQDIRTKIATRIDRNPVLNKLKLPIHLLHDSQSSTKDAASSDWNEASSTNLHKTPTTEALVPRHCRMTYSERQVSLDDSRKLDAPDCPIDVIVPQLFQHYNASEYFAEVVLQSEAWLAAARDYLSRIFYCLFVYVSSILLWNAAGAVLWFYLNRLNILPKKVLYESDVSSWYPTQKQAQTAS